MTSRVLWSRYGLLAVGHIAMLTLGCGLASAPGTTQALNSADVTVSVGSGEALGQDVTATANTEAASAAQMATALSEANTLLAPAGTPTNGPTGTPTNGEAITAGSVTPDHELEPPKATGEGIGEQLPDGDISQEEPRIAADEAERQVADARAQREAQEAAQAAAAAREAREKNLARCREIATEANRAIEHHRSTGRFNLDDILNRAHQDYEALAASFTRTIRGLHGQIAAHETVIASDPCRQVMSDATMQAWVISRHESVTRLSDSKENCRSAFFEPVLLRIATLPPACE